MTPSGVSGGLFNVQQQLFYTKLGTSAYPEYNYISNTLLTADIGQKWSLGLGVPLVYRYLVDPTHVGGPGSAPGPGRVAALPRGGG